MRANEATLAPNHPLDRTMFIVLDPSAMSTVADGREVA
jgi:hypothetical protein